MNSVLNQSFITDDFEVVVVNDSGQPLPEENWQRSPRVQIINTNRHNRSVARNTGAAVAKGRYLHFLDDDDWLLPGAFEKFWALANVSQAAWLYGAFRLVDNSEETIATICPDEVGNCYIQLIAWEWLPIQASLIESEVFFAVGGFAPLGSLMGGFEDIDLSRQIARYYEMAGTSGVVASIRIGDSGSTTNYADLFDQNRHSREKALNTPGGFARMKSSARADKRNPGYWHGQIVYYHLTSLSWNLRRGRLFTAVSRGGHLIAGFATAGQHLLSTYFWRGVSKPHLSKARIALDQSGLELYTTIR